MSDRQDAYRIATDGYVEMVRKMSRLRKESGSSAYKELPTAGQQAEHIMAIARFLTETDEQAQPDAAGPDYSTTDAMVERAGPYAPPIGSTGPEQPGITHERLEGK